MVVSEAAAIDTRCADTAHVVRMHAVMNSLVGPVMLAGGDACLEIDDTAVHAGTIEFRQCIAPDVVRLRQSRNRAVDPLGQFNVGASIADVGFVLRGFIWMSQDLIDAAACHHVTAEKKADRLRHAPQVSVLIAEHMRTNPFVARPRSLPQSV